VPDTLIVILCLELAIVYTTYGLFKGYLSEEACFVGVWQGYKGDILTNFPDCLPYAGRITVGRGCFHESRITFFGQLFKFDTILIG
jgi:hypothetical protein